MIVFVKYRIKERITKIDGDLVKTGYGGQFGNKGAVLVRMNVDDS